MQWWAWSSWRVWIARCVKFEGWRASLTPLGWHSDWPLPMNRNQSAVFTVLARTGFQKERGISMMKVRPHPALSPCGEGEPSTVEVWLSCAVQSATTAHPGGKGGKVQGFN